MRWIYLPLPTPSDRARALGYHFVENQGTPRRHQEYP